MISLEIYFKRWRFRFKYISDISQRVWLLGMDGETAWRDVGLVTVGGKGGRNRKNKRKEEKG